MAYRLTGVTKSPEEWGSLLGGDLSCYDTIGDPDFELSRDFLLHNRSAYEMVRDQLTPEQQADLDKVDAYWKANVKDFNADFAVFHHREDKTTALTGFVMDTNGNVPPIPRSHWWWWPIEG